MYPAFLKYKVYLFAASLKPNINTVSSNIIETKPITTKKDIEIKPSKTVATNKNKLFEKKPTTVHVNTQGPVVTASKVEIKSAPITTVNTVEAKSSTAVPHPPLIISKVQVRNCKII